NPVLTEPERTTTAALLRSDRPGEDGDGGAGGFAGWAWIAEFSEHAFERRQSHQNVALEDVTHVTNAEDLALERVLTICHHYSEALLEPFPNGVDRQIFRRQNRRDRRACGFVLDEKL